MFVCVCVSVFVCLVGCVFVCSFACLLAFSCSSKGVGFRVVGFGFWGFGLLGCMHRDVFRVTIRIECLGCRA